MNKKIFIVLILILSTAIKPYESNVYICGPAGAKKYHYSNSCRGLSNCKHQVYEVTKSKAVSLKLTLCGWED